MYYSKRTCWLSSAVAVCCILLLVPGNEAQRQRPNIFALFRQNFASRVGLVVTSTTTTTVTTFFTTTITETVTTQAPTVVEATSLPDSTTLNPLALAALLSLEGQSSMSSQTLSTTSSTTSEPTSSTESTTTTTTTTENSLLDTTLASTATSESPVIASPINITSSSSTTTTTLRSRPTSRLASSKRSSSSLKRPSLVLATDSNRFFGPGRESKLGKEELNQVFKSTPVSAVESTLLPLDYVAMRGIDIESSQIVPQNELSSSIQEPSSITLQ